MHDGDAVRVAVGGQPEVEPPIAHLVDQQPQRLDIRRRRTPAKEGIVAAVDGHHPAAGLGEHDVDGHLADAVHGIHRHAEPRPADGLHVHKALHRVDVLVRIVPIAHQAGRPRQGQLHLDHVIGGQGGGRGRDLAGFLVQEE